MNERLILEDSLAFWYLIPAKKSNSFRSASVIYRKYKDEVNPGDPALSEHDFNQAIDFLLDKGLLATPKFSNMDGVIPLIKRAVSDEEFDHLLFKHWDNQTELFSNPFSNKVDVRPVCPLALVSDV